MESLAASVTTASMEASTQIKQVPSTKCWAQVFFKLALKMAELKQF
jgi:hypothetical protein